MSSDNNAVTGAVTKMPAGKRAVIMQSLFKWHSAEARRKKESQKELGAGPASHNSDDDEENCKVILLYTGNRR